MSNNFQKMLLEKMKANKEKREANEIKREENKRIRESKKARSPSPISITHKHKEPESGLTPKEYKERSVMKAQSDLRKNERGNYEVKTDLKVRKGLTNNVKRALKRSVIEELDKGISGSGVRKIELDYSSDEEVKPKRRGRPPKKGKNVNYDSSSDEEEIKTYGNLLKHLVSHIKDPKEAIDPKDYKQAVMLIKKIKSMKS